MENLLKTQIVDQVMQRVRELGMFVDKQAPVLTRMFSSTKNINSLSFPTNVHFSNFFDAIFHEAPCP